MSTDVDTFESSVSETEDELDTPFMPNISSAIRQNQTILCGSVVNGKSYSSQNRNGITSKKHYTEGSVEWYCNELAIVVIESMSDVKIERRALKSNYKNKFSKTLLRTVNELSGKHEILFKGMMNKLQLDRDNIGITFTKVVDAIFADEQFNWGRIVTVYAFCGWLARHCITSDMSECIDELARISGPHIAARLGPWITQSGGWESFEKFFEKPESSDEKIWKGLLYTIFGLGVGAVATAIVVK